MFHRNSLNWIHAIPPIETCLQVELWDLLALESLCTKAVNCCSTWWGAQVINAVKHPLMAACTASSVSATSTEFISVSPMIAANSGTPAFREHNIKRLQHLFFFNYKETTLNRSRLSVSLSLSVSLHVECCSILKISENMTYHSITLKMSVLIFILHCTSHECQDFQPGPKATHSLEMSQGNRQLWLVVGVRILVWFFLVKKFCMFLNRNIRQKARLQVHCIRECVVKCGSE